MQLLFMIQCHFLIFLQLTSNRKSHKIITDHGHPSGLGYTDLGATVFDDAHGMMLLTATHPGLTAPYCLTCKSFSIQQVLILY